MGNVFRRKTGKHGVDCCQVPLLFYAKQDVIGGRPQRPAKFDEGFRCEAAAAKFNRPNKRTGKLRFFRKRFAGISKGLR